MRLVKIARTLVGNIPRRADGVGKVIGRKVPFIAQRGRGVHRWDEGGRAKSE